jgi:hypothetical protein
LDFITVFLEASLVGTFTPPPDGHPSGWSLVSRRGPESVTTKQESNNPRCWQTVAQNTQNFAVQIGSFRLTNVRQAAPKSRVVAQEGCVVEILTRLSENDWWERCPR